MRLIKVSKIERDLLGVGDIERQRSHAPGAVRVRRQALARGRVAHAGEHRPAAPRETQRGRFADARRGTGDQR